MLKKIIFIIIGIILTVLLGYFGYKGFFSLFFQNMRPETSMQNARFLVMSTENERYETNSYTNTETIYKSFKLINIKDNNLTEEIIDSLRNENEFIHSSIIINDIIYYLFQKEKKIQLISFDLASKNKIVIDEILINSVLGNPDMEDEIFSQLFYSEEQSSLLLYYDNKVRIYSFKDNTSKEITLWEDVVKNSNRNLKIPIGFKFTPDDYTVFSSQFGTRKRPISITLGDDDYLILNFENIYTKDDESSNAYSHYKNIDPLEIANYTVQIKCSTKEDYKCKMEYINENIISNMDHYQPKRLIREGKIAMNKSDEFVYIYSNPLYRINCGGWYQIGPCLKYNIASLNLVNKNGGEELFKYGSNKFIGHSMLRNIMFSDDGKHLAYSVRKKRTNTYLLDIKNKSKPKLIVKDAYPLYFEVNIKENYDMLPALKPFINTDNTIPINNSYDADAISNNLLGNVNFENDQISFDYDPDLFIVNYSKDEKIIHLKEIASGMEYASVYTFKITNGLIFDKMYEEKKTNEVDYKDVSIIKIGQRDFIKYTSIRPDNGLAMGINYETVIDNKYVLSIENNLAHHSLNNESARKIENIIKTISIKNY